MKFLYFHDITETVGHKLIPISEEEFITLVPYRDVMQAGKPIQNEAADYLIWEIIYGRHPDANTDPHSIDAPNLLTILIC